MLKTALFDCAINEKYCSVDGGRGICPLFSSPPRGIWQFKSPHPQEFASQGKKNANAWGLTVGGGGGGRVVIGRSWNWLHKNLVKSVAWQDLPALQSNHLSDASILGLSLLFLPKVAYHATNNPNHVFSPKFFLGKKYAF